MATSAPSRSPSSRNTPRARSRAAPGAPRGIPAPRRGLPATAPLLAALAVAAAFCLAPLAAAAQDAAPKSAADSASVADRRRNTILYGIDTEIMELLKSLASEKESLFNGELLTLLESSKGPKLRSAILDFFSSLEWKGAERAALAIVDGRDEEDSALVSSALAYLASVASKDALAYVPKMLEENDKNYMKGLVRLMGKSGGEAEEAILLDWFDGDSTTQDLKEEAIKALGEIGSSRAAERLERLVEDGEAGKAARMYACAALAKIGSPSSVGPLVGAANGGDPNVRASAIEALGSFRTAESEAAIVQGLRDSFVQARVAACKASGALRISEAEPYLRYKATSDPEKAVKTEACKALALMGGDSLKFLRERLSDKKTESSIRTLIFGLLARYDDGAVKLLEEILVAEQAEKNRGFYTSLVREIANAGDAPGIGSLARILLADKDFNMRIGGVEWIRKNKAAGMKADLERIAESDPSEPLRKRAAEALKSF